MIMVAGGEDAAQPERRLGGGGLGQAARGSERVHGSGGASPSLENEYSCGSDGHSASRDGERLRGSGGASPSLEDQDSCGAEGSSASGNGERLRGSGGGSPSRDDDAGVVDRSEDDRTFDEARRNVEPGGFDKNFANEPKSDEEVICDQDLAGIEVAANSALGEQANVVKSEDREQGAVGPGNGEQRLVERNGEELPASRPADQTGGAGAGAPRTDLEGPPGKPNGDRKLASGGPAAKNDRRKSERSRRRREKERIERMRIEHRIEEKLRSGKVTSASKLIEEVLWPSPKGVESGG
jgi:hypothetical protein